MAFNEPDACGWAQSYMQPVDAANAYRRYIMPYAESMTLGGPADSNAATGFP